jgi:hypothetical protein
VGEPSPGAEGATCPETLRQKDRRRVSTLERSSDALNLATGALREWLGTEGAMLSGKRTEGRQTNTYCRPIFLLWSASRGYHQEER